MLIEGLSVLLLAGHCSAIVHPEACLRSNKGYEYRGDLSTTISGRTCQPWNAQQPHRHRCRKLNRRRNYCSNDEYFYCHRARPWCFTTDPKAPWEYCDVPMCNAPLECLKTQKGFEYKGRQSKTVSGRTCQAWEFREPHQHNCNAVNHRVNYCTNDPNDECQAAVPWCYTTDTQTPWEFCDIPMCHDVCLESPEGFEYRGHQNRTKSGRTCQAWSAQTPHKHNCSVAFDRMLPRRNYCSNKRGDVCGGDRPWCYTTDPAVRWEYCRIPLCQDLDECLSRPCQHGGKCVQKGTGYYCTCNATYRGEICEIFDACLSRPCLNSATCEKLGRRYQCTCVGTFSGTNCQLVDACKSHPCRNNGTCVSRGADYNCTCRSSYSGKDCTVDILLCANADSLCLRGGRSRINGTFIACDDCRKYVEVSGGRERWLSCPDLEGWGFNVDTRQCQLHSPHCYPCDDPCHMSPCGRRGTCRVVGNQYECLCPAGAFGNRCQLTGSACEGRRCEHGGTCVVDGAYDETSNYVAYSRCNCRLRYAGNRCEQCVGVFRRVSHRRHRGGRLRPDKTSVRACQEACMEATVYCAAVDFTNGACTVHYTNDYDESRLDFSNRATHYRLVPCPDKVR